VQLLEKRQEALKETIQEEPIEASQERCRGPTKVALEACPSTSSNTQENESKNPSIKQGLMLGSRVFML